MMQFLLRIREQVVTALSKPGVVIILAFLWFSVGAWRGLTVDEYTTWNNTRKPLGELVANRLRAGHLPTFFALERFWVLLAGESEFALRMPSILLASLSVTLAFLFIRDRFSLPIACVATLLLATNQVTVWCAQNARPYAGVLLSIALIAWALERYFSCGRRGALGLVALGVVLGISFYAATALSIVTLGAICGTRFHKDFRRALGATLALVIPLLIMFLPLLMLAQQQEKFEDFGAPAVGFDIKRPFHLLARTVFGDYRLWARGFVRWPLLIGFCVLAVKAWQWLGKNQAETSTVKPLWLTRCGVFAWMFLPLVGLVVTEIMTSSNVLSHPRYLVHSLIPIAIVEAVGIKYWVDRLRGGNLGKQASWLIPAAVVVLNLSTTLAWFSTNGDGPRVVAARMLEKSATAAAVLGTTHPLEYEWRAASHPPLIAQYIPQGDVIEKVSSQGPFFVFVYNNRLTAWDDWLTTAAVRRYAVIERFEYRDARAFLLSPKDLRHE
ncbi:MAG: glycosyltransferase family 39 protein [Candidatus Sumerlaeaceae bacterium]|nr:glycosyltransferase family 39 protein [Candidatus Sumerlaeaceae bacterium]